MENNTTAQQATYSYRFYRRTWALFCSLRLTLVVLLSLAASLFVGMFWDQTLSLQEHLASYSEDSVAAKIFVFLELNDVFHSWWFSLVVLLLALNLIACSFERLPKIWIDIHNPDRYLTDGHLSRLALKHSVTLPSFEEAKSSAVAFLGQKIFFTESRGDDHFFYAEKHKYARCGVYVVHIALLFIMFGSIAATNLGLDGMLMIEEGGANHYVQAKGPGGLPYYHALDFDVVCTDFKLKTFVDGSPMAFESDLVIVDPKDPTRTPIVEKTIRVNDPLFYAGYTFYQSSYQPVSGEERLRLLIGPHGGERRAYALQIGERVQMPDGTVFVPLEHVEDFGGFGSALKVQQTKKGGVPSTFFVFRQYPDFDPYVRRGEWDLYFQGVDLKYATGVSVGRVPGVSQVFIGFALMFVGLYMAFCMNHRRYYARIRKNGAGYELTLAGHSRRHQTAFKEEFMSKVSK